MNGDIKERILALQAKAAAKQAAVDACDGHIWRTDYVSKIIGGDGSCVCIRCGERRGWKDIGPHEQYEHDAFLPAAKQGEK